MNYTAIDQMCVALMEQIRDYVQPGDTRPLNQLLGLNEIEAEELEDPTGDQISVTDGEFDLESRAGFSSVILIVNYYKSKASAAPEDRELRRAMERIRCAIMSNESIVGGVTIEGLTAEKGVFPGAEELDAITGGQILVNYSVPQSDFAQESRG